MEEGEGVPREKTKDGRGREGEKGLKEVWKFRKTRDVRWKGVRLKVGGEE